MDDSLYRLDFSSDELKSLPAAHAGFLVASCLAIGEVAIFQRLLLMALNALNPKYEDVDEIVAEYALGQALTLQRTLSGKLKEYLYMCAQYQDGCKQRNDTDLQPFLDESMEVCVKLKTMAGYELADWYRDKVTHHYIIKHIASLLKHTQQGLSYPIYLHEKDGNAGYFLGERVLRHKLNDLPGRETIETLNDYQDWVMEAAKSVQALHHSYCIQLLQKYFPEKMASQVRVRVPKSLTASPNATKLPLFWVLKGAANGPQR